MVVAAFDSREIGNKGLSVKATKGQPGLLSSQCTSNHNMNQKLWPSIRFLSLCRPETDNLKLAKIKIQLTY